MAYTIIATARDEVKITLGSYDVELTPVKIINQSYIEEEADISIDPEITPTANVYTLTGDPADEFIITFNEDGVYKLYITENSIDYLHIVIVSNDVDDYFEEVIPTLINCSPNDDCTQDPDHLTYYDFNVISMLTIGFFGETNENVHLNYETFTSGNVYANNIYQCLSIGSGTYNWQDSNGNDLFTDMSGNIITNTSALTLNEYYKCIKTGTPVSYGSVTPAGLTLNTTSFQSWLNGVVDSLYRFTTYINSSIDSNE